MVVELIYAVNLRSIGIAIELITLLVIINFLYLER